MFRALILHPAFRQSDDKNRRSAASRLEEACGLASAIDLDIRKADVVVITRPRPSTLFGSGQIERRRGLIEAEEIDVIIVDTALSPVQQRNLEKEWKAKVIDRTALILEIFGARARTHEGKLQVELAALEYQKSRLVRSWTHLERQRGGFGFLGGPGESQIELDRRMIRDRIGGIKRQLERVMRTRQLHRKTRRDVPYPTVALVGYTNAGKSTLFNSLTKAGILAADALFATLDPTIRKVVLPSGLGIMLSDTVGFISDLPTELIAAFRATLEEVLEADLLLHVRDLSHDDSEAQRQDVVAVLRQLFKGVESAPPVIEVRNKIDLLPDADVMQSTSDDSAYVAVSALTGAGLPELCTAIETHLSEKLLETRSYVLGAADGKAVAWLHSHAQVDSKQMTETGECRLRVRITPTNIARFERLRKESV